MKLRHMAQAARRWFAFRMTNEGRYPLEGLECICEVANGAPKWVVDMLRESMTVADKWQHVFVYEALGTLEQVEDGETIHDIFARHTGEAWPPLVWMVSNSYRMETTQAILKMDKKASITGAAEEGMDNERYAILRRTYEALRNALVDYENGKIDPREVLPTEPIVAR